MLNMLSLSPFFVEMLLMVFSLTGLLFLSFALFFTKNFLTDILMLSLFSLLSCFFYVIVDGADVAVTEASVGAGVSIVILLATLLLTHGDYRASVPRYSLFSHGCVIMLVFLSFVGFLYALTGMVPYGDPESYAISYVAPYYLEISDAVYHIPNVVTLVLGSFRGYDTMGETTVIFTAAVATLSILSALKYTVLEQSYDS